STCPNTRHPLFTFTALGVIPTLGVAETVDCSAFADLQASPQTPNRGDHEQRTRTLTLYQPCGLLKEGMKKWFKLLYL
ncbi:hypothetical protein B0H14DRAFT_2706787, partial [Mycena olivaceomarginata]